MHLMHAVYKMTLCFFKTHHRRSLLIYLCTCIQPPLLQVIVILLAHLRDQHEEINQRANSYFEVPDTPIANPTPSESTPDGFEEQTAIPQDHLPSVIATEPSISSCSHNF